MKEKPIVGQKLFSLNIGNARRYATAVLTPVVVVSVGRKFFKCETVGLYHFGTEYRLSDWTEKTIHCANSKLYTSEQEWLDENELSEACLFIWRAFEYGNNRHSLRLATVRAITELIKTNSKREVAP